MGLTKLPEDDPRRLIDWSELSRRVTGGDRNGIRANKVPKKHRDKVNKLLKAIEEWQKLI